MSNWTIDFPRADRHVAEMVRRLTAIDARSVEQSVDLDDGDDVFDWPWLYAVEVGHWDLTDTQARKLREYLTARRVPDGRRLPWHAGVGQCSSRACSACSRTGRSSTSRTTTRSSTSFGTSTTAFRCRVRSSCTATAPTRRTATTPHWRGIYDDKGRIMVAICHNMDLGDSVEHSDNSELSREVLRSGHADLHQLHPVRDDPLIAACRSSSIAACSA